MKKTTLALALSAAFYVNYATAQDAQPNVVNITINNVGDESGLEMGTGSRARGQGSIATGKNSVALGKNAVATGGNETKDSINAKLAENKQKLADIATAEANTNRLLGELQKIRKVEADVIEAGERVKQVRLAKQSAYNVWQDKLKTYNDTVAGSAQFLKDAQAKIDDLNSRLTGVSRIQNVDISSDEGLTNAATQLKSIAEEGTTLNLSVDFYKDYVSSYYQALGDLRQNKLIYNISDSDNFDLLKSAGVQNLVNAYKYLSSTRSLRASTYNNGILSFGLNVDNPYFGKNTFTGIEGTTQPSANLFLRDIETQITTLEEWESAKSLAPVFKSNFKIFFDNTNDPYMTAEVKSAALNALNKKIDIYVKSNEVTYYQGQYESTRNTVWLDKKQQAIKEYNQLVAAYGALPVPSYVKQKVIENWKAENIDAIMQRNNITTATLTSELEKALGINKNAIAEKEAEIARLKTAADQAKNTYDNTNPSAADIALSQRYEEIMAQLTAKANELKSEQDRLQALRDALTLHDLTNVGENAYAIGTNALATGTNSLAIGTDTIVTGENSIAMGKGAVVTGTNSIAIGTGHNVLGNNSGAFGDPDYIYGDGSYAFGNNNTIGDPNKVHQIGNNTFVLGSNVVTTANNAVILGANSTDGGDNTVSVGSATAPRKIVYVADGDITATSKDAINGSQLFTIKEALKSIQPAGSIDESFADAVAKNFGGGSEYVKSPIESTIVDALVPNTSDSSISLDMLYTSDTFEVVRYPDGDMSINGYIVKSGDKLPDGFTIEGDKMIYAGKGKLTEPTYSITNVTNNTSTDYNNVGDALTALNSNTKALNTALSNKADKTDITNINTSLDGINTALNGKANTSLNNITSDGETVIKNLAKGAVKVVAGTNTTVTESTDGDAKTYAVNVSNEAIKGAVQKDLDSKANKDASNLETADVQKWQEKLGNGTNTKGDKGLITGNTLNIALETKADKGDITTINTSLSNKANTDLENITNNGKTVIKNLARDAVEVVNGTNTTVSKTVKDGKASYAVNVPNDAIKGAVQKDLDSKANKDASNLETADVQKWQEKLGNGTNTKGDKGLITGDTLYTAINGINAVASVNNLAGDVAQHLGGGATAVDGRVTVPTYSIKDVATNATGVYNSVGGAIQALDRNTQALSARMDGMSGEISNLRKDLSDTRKEAFAGTATALAVAGLGQSTSPGKTSVSMSTSAYRGQTGYAIGVSRLSESGKFLLKGAVSGNNRGHYGGVVSATYTFD